MQQALSYETNSAWQGTMLLDTRRQKDLRIDSPKINLHKDASVNSLSRSLVNTTLKNTKGFLYF